MQPDAPRPVNRVWWCNADFDLTLAHGGGKMPAQILEAARGMAWHLWPALAPGDVLLVPEAPPDGFPESLNGLGLAPPRFIVDPVVDRGIAAAAAPPDLFTPFGWNAEAVRRNAGRAHPSEHPDLAVVRRVNSRAFGLELERELSGEDACPAVFCAAAAAVDAWLERARPGRYVAKGNHGHAGIGQLRFALPGDVASLAAKLKRLAARHGGVVIEEEQRVEREWGLLFRLGREGGISEFRVHRLLSDAAGGYAGALVPAAGEIDPLREAHRDRAEAAARGVAAALRRAGYHGPVGIDQYLHRTRGGLRLRPLVDLNARQSMAWPAHGLAARFPGRAILLLQFPATRFGVSGVDAGTRTPRDILSYDSAAARGAIWITPRLPLTRHSVAFIGNDEADVLKIQGELLGRHEAMQNEK